MKKFLKWLKWKRQGKPSVVYSGFNCGCCGKWVIKKFSIPTYKSIDEWWDAWGVCDECAKGGEKE